MRAKLLTYMKSCVEFEKIGFNNNKLFCPYSNSFKGPYYIYLSKENYHEPTTIQ